MHKYLRRGWCGLGMLTLGCVSGKAIEPIDVLLFRTGPFALKPQFSVSETYNDNIFFRNEQKVSDLVTTISPGLNLQIGSRDYNFIEISYTYDQLLYAQESEQNADQHRVGVVVLFEYGRLLLSGGDRIEMLATPLGGGISFRGEKVERNAFFDDYRLTYELSEKTSPYLEISHSTIDFDEGLRLYDSTTVYGTVGVDYKAFSRTSFFGETYFGQTIHEPNAPLGEYPTATFVGVFLGLRGNFTEKLTGSLKAGYELRYYSVEDEGSSGLPVVELSLTEQFSERTTLSLTYSHRQRESVQFTRSSYSSHSVTGRLLQQIGNEGRFRASLDASYILSSYDENASFVNGREDDLISAGVTLAYDFKLWLRGYLAYNFEHFDSTTPVVFDYDVNRVTLGVTLGY